MAGLTSRATGKTGAQIIGIKQVEDTLNKLPKDLNKKILGQACRSSAKFIQQAAKWNVERYSKRVAKQVVILSMKKTFRAGVWIKWKSKVTGSKRADTAWEAMGGHWLEHGTSGVGGRQIQPVGWFRRAVDTKIGQTEREFKKILHNKINLFLDKYITRNGW